MVRPFRFMLRLPDVDQPFQKWKDAVRWIEDCRFATAVLPDHFTQGYATEPIVGLTAAICASERLRVACRVHANDYRHPVMLHRALATLDVLSGGRVEIGMGTGWMKSDYHAAGIPYDSPDVRVARLAESVKIVKGLFGDKPFSFQGRYYRIDSLQGMPPPVQRPHPPLLIGGGGRRILALAASDADIVGIGATMTSGELRPEAMAKDFSAETIDQKVGWVREAAQGAGRILDDIEMQMGLLMCKVTASAAQRREAVEEVASALRLQPKDVTASPAILIGTVSQCVDSLLERRERWGFSYINLGTELETVAPIVEQLAGT